MENIRETDFFILAVMLTIASRDHPECALAHRYCWDHTQRLLLDVLLAYPWTQDPRTVKGLLLLSEWLPQIQTHATATLEASNNPFSEDRTAWSLIGQAVRLGYLLGLDRGAFRDQSGRETEEQNDDRRLVWTCKTQPSHRIGIVRT